MRARVAAWWSAVLRQDTPGARRQLTWLCVLTTGIILLAGLWPLRFSAPNNARWLPDAQGLFLPGGEALSDYDPGGVLYTPLPLTAHPGVALDAGAMSIELWLQPGREPAGARGRMLSVCDENLREEFFLGQWTTELLVMVHQSEAKAKPAWREFDVKDALSTNQPRFVTVTSGPRGTRIYLDGALAKHFPRLQLLTKIETMRDKRIYLGNAPDGNSPWSGTVFGLALFGRVLSASQAAERYAAWMKSTQSSSAFAPQEVARYDFRAASGRWVTNQAGRGNALWMPAQLQFQKPLLAPFHLAQSDYGDFLLNLVGFMPLGFFLTLLVRSRTRLSCIRTITGTVLAGAALSLAIEFVQVELPMRDSSQTDLVLNMLGTLLGALLICLPAFRK